jgi:cell division septal protein FtsQ
MGHGHHERTRRKRKPQKDRRVNFSLIFAWIYLIVYVLLARWLHTLQSKQRASWLGIHFSSHHSWTEDYRK